MLVTVNLEPCPPPTMHYDPILTEYSCSDPFLRGWKRPSQVLHLLTELYNSSSVPGTVSHITVTVGQDRHEQR